MKNLFGLIGGGVLWIPSMLILPILFSIFIGLGFTRENIIEDSVYRIWAKEGSDYYQDRRYGDDVGWKSRSSSMLALASTRDGGNLLTEKRLEEIRTRMEKTESVTVTYKNNVFFWQDICARNNIGLGTVYEFPCVRLSPMDLFQEARWSFTEKDRLSFYKKGIYDNVVSPRIGRFGVMSNVCGKTPQSPCTKLINYRMLNNPLQLFSDLTIMELDDPCRVCVESAYDNYMVQLTQGTIGLFGAMAQLLNGHLQILAQQDPNASYGSKSQKIQKILSQVMKILKKIDRKAIETFFMYYTARGVYQQIGATAYLANYPNIQKLFSAFGMAKLEDRIDSLMNDGSAKTKEQAESLIAAYDLGKHADAPFSSVNSAGTPFPIPNIGPSGGAGIDLSGKLFSSFDYFDIPNIQNKTAWKPLFSVPGLADPEDEKWVSLVDTDPVFNWFIADETQFTSHCGDDIVPTKLLVNKWCNKFSEPYLEDGTFTKQHFAIMWYNMLIDSKNFLNLKEGEADPYTWTNGNGCGYNLGGSRDNYRNATEDQILKTASGYLYFLDEGVNIGSLEKKLLIGGTSPRNVDEANAKNPLTKVTSIQNIYPALIPEAMVDRVKNINRPGVGPLNITEDDAKKIIEEFKKKMVEQWSSGWDNKNDGDVQFVAFFDSVGADGTFTEVLRDISDDSVTLTLISIVFVVLVSVLFFASCDLVKSRIGIILVAVGIVVLSFMGALGLSVLVGIKININIAWTLPFIMIGLGVDDMYIVMNAMATRTGNSDSDFVKAMNKIFLPVSMTSLVNGSMFTIMYIITDIQAIYKTAAAALIAVAFLWLSVVFCFPAYCYLDMKRQAANRCDILCCIKGKTDEDNNTDDDNNVEIVDSYLYLAYQKVFLGQNIVSYVAQAMVVVGTIAFLVVGAIGISRREVGVGLKDFFPKEHQANRWAEIRSEDLATWPIAINWGRVDYTKTANQLKMMKQFEEVVDTKYVGKVDTQYLWIAAFNLWTTRHCEGNFQLDNPEIKECGRDTLYIGSGADNNTYCEGGWAENTLGLKTKWIDDLFATSDTCSPFEDGVCRPASDMFVQDLAALGASKTNNTKSYCPIFEGWSTDKLKFCVEKWRQYTGGLGGLLTVDNTATPYKENGVVFPGEYYFDDDIKFPIPISTSPTLYATGLYKHSDTVDMIKQTRAICDDSSEIHCFMSGVPFDFWEQYLTVDEVLLKLTTVSVAVGFAMATLFLFIMLNPANKEDFHIGHKLLASAIGGFLIAVSITMSLIPVIGISFLAGVTLTAFSNMSFVLSVAFATEYSVHVVHRFLSAPTSIQSPNERVEYTMKFLSQPLTLSFLSSTIGVICLSFTDFDFNERFFFRPLMIVMAVTYFIGTFFLPILLTKLDLAVLKVGDAEELEEKMANIGNDLEFSEGGKIKVEDGEEDKNRSN